MRSSRDTIRAAAVVGAIALAAVIAVAWAAAPTVQALLRATRPPTDAMRAASAHVDLTGTASTPPRPAASPRTDRERLAANAHRLLGIPYEWGAKGPEAFDCSGFTKAAYASIGVTIPDGSFNQAEGERPLSSLADLTPGDLLFYRWPGSKGVGHVTMYIGDGWVIGTGSPGQPKAVTVYPLASDFAQAPGTIVTFRHVVLPDER
ncbi:MAG: C40 family peptidase [Anaerosomatales bacterium]|nr:C40 family peptidase [Anaerosomatales bacterium]